MSKVYIGVDIGKSGAIAVIHGNTVTTHKMPMIKTELDYHALSELIFHVSSEINGTHIAFEKLGVIFGSSKQVAFSMGEQSGAVQMACIANRLPYTKVNAKDWQKQMFQGVDEITRAPNKLSKGTKPVRDTKAMALMAVKRIFPELKLTFGDKATVPHDGLIDAVLIAEYARRNSL